MHAQSRHLHIIHIFQAETPARKSRVKPSKTRPIRSSFNQKWRLIQRLVLTDAEFQSSNLHGLVDIFANQLLLGKKKRKPVPSMYAHHYAGYVWRGGHYELNTESYDHKGSIKVSRYVDPQGNPVTVGQIRSVADSWFPWSNEQHKAKKRAAATRRRPRPRPVRTPCRAGFGDRYPVRVSPNASRVPASVISHAVERFRNCDWGSTPRQYWEANDAATHDLARLDTNEALLGTYESGLRGRDKKLLIAISAALGPGIWALLPRDWEDGGHG